MPVKSKTFDATHSGSSLRLAKATRKRRCCGPQAPRPLSSTAGRPELPTKNRRPTTGRRHAERSANSGRRECYWIASGATNVPVKPTTLGTVMEKKNVARPSPRCFFGDQVGPRVLDDVNTIVGEKKLSAPETPAIRDLRWGLLGPPSLSTPTDERSCCAESQSRGVHADSRLARMLYSAFCFGYCRNRSCQPVWDNDHVTFTQGDVVDALESPPGRSARR